MALNGLASFWSAPTSVKELREAEKRLLDHGNADVSAGPSSSPDSPCFTAVAEDVHIGAGDQDYIHNLFIRSTGDPPSSSPKPKLVILTGYGGGVALFYRVLPFLSKAFDILAVDHLGTGLSGRPEFTATTNAEAIDFFVVSFERWAQVQGLLDPQSPPFYVLAHSMGVYLTLEFARRHPGRVHQLLAIAPAGLTAKKIEPKAAQNIFSIPGLAFRALKAAWDWGLTPGVLVRTMGPFGRIPPRHYCADRFYGVSHTERESIADYLYHISAHPPSAEAALPLILKPQVWSPWSWESKGYGLIKDVPLTMIYTENDGLDYREGVRAAQALLALQPKAQRSFPQHLKVFVIRYGGHFGFLNSTQEFFEAIKMAVRAPPKVGQGAKAEGRTPVKARRGRPSARKDKEAVAPSLPDVASPPMTRKRARGAHSSKAGEAWVLTLPQEDEWDEEDDRTLVMVDGLEGPLKRRERVKDMCPTAEHLVGGNQVFNGM